MKRSQTETTSLGISQPEKLSQESKRRKRLMTDISENKRKANDSRLFQNQSSMKSITKRMSTMTRGTVTMSIVRNESTTSRASN